MGLRFTTECSKKASNMKGLSNSNTPPMFDTDVVRQSIKPSRHKLNILKAKS